MDETIDAVFDLNGGLRLASAGATALFAHRPDVLTVLAARVRAFAVENIDDRLAPLDALPCRLSRLVGDNADPRVLARLVIEKPPAGPFAKLSARQRQVAESAAAGATVHEIARELSLSSETVRSHLQEIYRRLGVKRRVELARLLAQR